MIDTEHVPNFVPKEHKIFYLSHLFVKLFNKQKHLQTKITKLFHILTL